MSHSHHHCRGAKYAPSSSAFCSVSSCRCECTWDWVWCSKGTKQKIWNPKNFLVIKTRGKNNRKTQNCWIIFCLTRSRAAGSFMKIYLCDIVGRKCWSCNGELLGRRELGRTGIIIIFSKCALGSFIRLVHVWIASLDVGFTRTLFN